VKPCVACGEPIAASRRADAKYCTRECSNNNRQKAYAQRHPKRTREGWHRYYRSDRGTITALLNGAQDRARRGGYDFDLDREFIAKKLAAGVCEYSGLPFERGASAEDFRARPFAPSLDRIVPALGYVKSNVRMVCFAVNMALSDWGDDVFLRIAQAVVRTANGDATEAQAETRARA
jgi:hypothetical protein